MTIKTEIIALAVRLASEYTTLIRKPEPFEALLTEIFGGESYDRQLARNIEEEADRVLNTAKRVHLNRKFNKIIKHI